MLQVPARRVNDARGRAANVVAPSFSMQDPTRKRAAITAAAEKRVLTAMARRMPAPIHSDHLTIIGTLGALGAGAGYALSGFSPHWLWLASASLIVNWFGDSLDGTLARVRGTQRPRYGYYLDHAVDALTTVVIGVGIGLSPYVPLAAALLAVVLYLMMSVNVYLESTVYDVFRMDYGRFGPTEMRIALIAGNTALIAADVWGGLAPAGILPGASVGVAVGIGAMSLFLLIRFARNLRRLGRLEPPAHRGAAVAADEPASVVPGR
jgi:archaetidylinositol phosphate synthase